MSIPTYNGCTCPCHSGGGIMHVAPCCRTPSPSLVSGDVVEAVAFAAQVESELRERAPSYSIYSVERPHFDRAILALAGLRRAIAALSVSDPLVRQLVEAEREACAKIADLAADVNDYTDKPSMKVAQDHARGIAARIRNRADAIATLQHKPSILQAPDQATESP